MASTLAQPTDRVQSRPGHDGPQAPYPRPDSGSTSLDGGAVDR